jgi:TetR/AcrR family transcriptional regulator, fatty acid biosynthesis regulator
LTAQARRLTRHEAKQVTRRRLLDAALQILNESGETDVSASTVARAAGIAQPSFYEHFRNKNELLRALGDELFTVLRRALREARRQALEAPTSEEAMREQFRRPLQMIAANPAWFRLGLRTRHVVGSPLGESSREWAGNTRLDIADELIQRGYPNLSPADRRRVEMVADGLIALTEAMALGHLSGRYPDIEEIVDMLILFTHGPRELRTRRTVIPPALDAVD